MKSWLKDFGALVALVALAGTGLVAWGSMTARVDEHDKRLTKVETTLDEIAKSLYRIEGALGTKKDGDK